MNPLRRRVLATTLAVLFALNQGVLPAFSVTEEEVEQARQEREAAARDRAAALEDLDTAVARYEEIRGELEQLTYRVGKLRAQLDVYEAHTRNLSADIREHAVDAYMGGQERDQVARVFSPEQVQQTMIAREVLALAVENDAATLDSYLANVAEMERLREEYQADAERLHELEVESEAIVIRMNELFAEADQEFQQADATATQVEQALAEQRRREEEERRAREAAQRQLDLIRASLGAPELGVPMSVTPGFICPVGGRTWFSNTWGAPRSGGRTHKGTDMFASHMTPLVAVADGVVRKSYGSLGGVIIWLYADHGVHYFYAHLDSYPPNLVDGQRVRKGDVVGYVGDTGNAAPGAYHLHFGMRPGGITNVNPYPTVEATCP